MAWVSKYWGMVGIMKGLAVTMKHILKVGNRPQVTVQYPYERMPLAERFRGLHVVYEDRCIGCGLCEISCPNATIKIVRYKKWYPQFDIGKCMFCGLCVDACPEGALIMGGKYELADSSRERLIYTPDRVLR